MKRVFVRGVGTELTRGVRNVETPFEGRKTFFFSRLLIILTDF